MQESVIIVESDNCFHQPLIGAGSAQKKVIGLQKLQTYIKFKFIYLFIKNIVFRMKFNVLCILLLNIVEYIIVLTSLMFNTLCRYSVWNFRYIESLRYNFYWGQ